MAHNDVVVHEEEDLGAALQKLEIPFKELEENPFDSTDDGLDGLKEIIEDSNLLLDDAQESEDPSTHLKPFQNLSNLPTATRGRSLAPKRPRNKHGRRKRRYFKSAACLFGPVTDKSCLHCGTRNTPLWREGPKGPGTLCNACGMRYRTGRLLPEYRPASSPGFKSNVHSNFHRKVMEIRREKNPPPNSFGFQH